MKINKNFLKPYLIIFIFIFYPYRILFAQNIYLENEMQKSSVSYYRQGLKYALDGNLKDAKEQFRKALLINEFSKNAEDAIKMIEYVEGKQVNELVAKTFFSTAFLELELQEVKNKITKLTDEVVNLKQRLDNNDNEIKNLQTNFENKILNIKSDIDDIENDIDYLKNTIRSR